MTKKSGQSKCCGYVEFSNEKDAAKALSSQIEINGRPIQCFISNPPRKSQPNNQMEEKPGKKGQLSKINIQPIINTGRKQRIDAFSFVPRVVAVKKA